MEVKTEPNYHISELQEKDPLSLEGYDNFIKTEFIEVACDDASITATGSGSFCDMDTGGSNEYKLSVNVKESEREESCDDDLQKNVLIHSTEEQLFGSEQNSFNTSRVSTKDRDPTQDKIADTAINHKYRYACELCYYHTAYKAWLDRHMLTHTAQKRFAFVCESCPYKSNCNSNWLSHKLTHTGERHFTCEYCSYKCHRKSVFERHMRIHTGEKPFACDSCPYEFRAKAALTRHMLTHTDDKPFACDSCPYKCRRKANLEKHKLTHTGERPFACDSCPYTSCRKRDLVRHMLTHTAEKEFACKSCLYKGNNKKGLAVHMCSHIGEKRFAGDVVLPTATLKAIWPNIGGSLAPVNSTSPANLVLRKAIL